MRCRCVGGAAGVLHMANASGPEAGGLAAALVAAGSLFTPREDDGGEADTASFNDQTLHRNATSHNARGWADPADELRSGRHP
jgi:hypothetical protein